MNSKKSIINLIYFISKYYNQGIIQERIKNIHNDSFQCITKQELEIKRYSNSCNYMFNNVNQSFKEELLIQSYFLLTNEVLGESITKKIIEIYYKNFDTSSHSLASLVHLYIINNVKNKNIEFAFLISNYIMLKKERSFLMPCDYCHKDYKEAIENNDISSLIRIFYDIELINKEKKPCLMTLDEVIQRIKSLKKELITEYNVERLYLFGSFAKGKNTEKSDLDFLMILGATLINKEKNGKTKLLKEFFSEEFNCDVDLLEFIYALDTFDTSQMENVITLI